MLWGKSFPRIRTLLYILYRCPQARLRTFPAGLGNRGDERSGIEMGRQEREVQIALHQAAYGDTHTRCKQSRERLLDVGVTAMNSIATVWWSGWGLPPGCRQFLQLCVSIVR